MTAHLCISTYKSPGQDVLKLELCFVGQDCLKIPAILGATYGCQTRRLDLSFNALSSLDGLERFPQLEELILDNNRLTDSARWPDLPLLTTLSLNKNLFYDLLSLLTKLRSSCPQLRYLSFLNNFASPDQLSSECDEQQYGLHRLIILQYLPKLKFLDSRRVRTRELNAACAAKGKLLPILKNPSLLPTPDSEASRDSWNGAIFRRQFNEVRDNNHFNLPCLD